MWMYYQISHKNKYSTWNLDAKLNIEEINQFFLLSSFIQAKGSRRFSLVILIRLCAIWSSLIEWKTQKPQGTAVNGYYWLVKAKRYYSREYRCRNIVYKDSILYERSTLGRLSALEGIGSVEGQSRREWFVCLIVCLIVGFRSIYLLTCCPSTIWRAGV